MEGILENWTCLDVTGTAEKVVSLHAMKERGWSEGIFVLNLNLSTGLTFRKLASYI